MVKYTWKNSEIIYSITNDKTAIVGTNTHKKNYNAVEKNYQSIEIPDTISINEQSYTITEIGIRAFYNYSALQTINLPSSLIRINAQAFDMAAANFGELKIPESVAYIGYLAFASNIISSVYIGENVETIGFGAFAYSTAKISCEVSKDNKFFCSDESKNLFDKGKRRLIQQNLSLASYTVPSSVQIIDNGAFAKTNSEEIILPESVKSLEQYCFGFSSYLKRLIIYGNPTFKSACMSGSKMITDVYYCGAKAVNGEHFSITTVNVHTCFGYKGTTFAGINVNSSNKCIANPVRRCSQKIVRHYFSIIHAMTCLLLISS